MTNIENIKKIAKKCLKCKNARCSSSCPINNPIPEIMELINNEQIEEAKKLLFNNSNVSLVCSKLCDHQKLCYGNCVLNKISEPIPFYQVEEYLSQFYSENFLIYDQSLKNKKIIIIGAGISGISLAIDFAKSGADVTIVEKEDRIGGIIYTMLPRFRFDDSIIQKYEKILDNLGVKIILNCEFGKDFSIFDTKLYDACIFAMGLEFFKSTFSDNPYLLKANDILSKAKKQQAVISNYKVLVIGGGNVAMDVARTLKKMNNEVEIVYRRDIANSPAAKKEIADALDENIIFNECLAPVKLIFENKMLKALEVEKMDLIDDGSQRKSFRPTGKYQQINCDYIVEAIGQNGNYQYVKDNLPEIFDQNGWINSNGVKKDSTYYFATGDYLQGASSFSHATKVSKEIFRKVKEIL